MSLSGFDLIVINVKKIVQGKSWEVHPDQNPSSASRSLLVVNIHHIQVPPYYYLLRNLGPLFCCKGQCHCVIQGWPFSIWFERIFFHMQWWPCRCLNLSAATLDVWLCKIHLVACASLMRSCVWRWICDKNFILIN